MIELRGVHYEYPDGTIALAGVDLRFGEGERVAIVGQNGAGKTTAVKLLNGLLRPSRGQVLAGGSDTASRTAAQLSREVGYVFQNPNDQIFNPTVEREVGYSLRRARIDEDERRRRVRAALEIVGLTEHAETNPLDLPFTTRRFVTIATVLALRPRFVVLDEPTAGQDPDGVARLEAILAHLSDEGIGAIVITHDMEFVASAFSRVVAMAEGRVVSDGPPRELFATPSVLQRARLEPPVAVALAQAVGHDDVLMLDELFERVAPLYGETLGTSRPHAPTIHTKGEQ
jgi:energy-coupling factor transport system ATP-binding protein